nr:immunoglobulin heavy chain junction region [Mus musculus]
CTRNWDWYFDVW